MGWLTGSYVRQMAKEPYKVRIRLDSRSYYDEVYDEEVVYEKSKLGLELVIFDGTTAHSKAESRAEYVREHGFSAGGVHYPVHRIKQVDVIKCKWEVRVVEA